MQLPPRYEGCHEGSEMNENTIKITPEFIIDLAIRRRWVILVPFCLALIIGIVLAFVLPKRYQASTLILIEPPRVPQSYVQPIVSSDASDMVDTISQRILSRTNLEKVISEFNLFSDPEQANMFIEDKISALRKAIDISVTRDRRGADAFSISFKGRNPKEEMSYRLTDRRNVSLLAKTFLLTGGVLWKERSAIQSPSDGQSLPEGHSKPC